VPEATNLNSRQDLVLRLQTRVHRLAVEVEVPRKNVSKLDCGVLGGRGALHRVPTLDHLHRVRRLAQQAGETNMRSLKLADLVVDREVVLVGIKIVGELVEEEAGEEVEVDMAVGMEVVSHQVDLLYQQIHPGLVAETITMVQIVVVAAGMIIGLLACHLDLALVGKEWGYQVGHVQRDDCDVGQGMASGSRGILERSVLPCVDKLAFLYYALNPT
jgi:hypothetical protein